MLMSMSRTCNFCQCRTTRHIEARNKPIHSDHDRDLSTTNTNALGRSLDVSSNDACELIHILVDGLARIAVAGSGQQGLRNRSCGQGSQWTPHASRYSAASLIEEITACKHVCGLLCACVAVEAEERLDRSDFAVVPDWVYMMLSADEVCAPLGQPAVP